MEKTERQINLIALLMDSERPVPLDRIHDALYLDQPSDDAFKRMFERDKDDLRSLGIRVEMDAIGAWSDGYVVRREEATLPDLGLTPAEHAALMLAAQAWGDGVLGSSSPRIAGLKLAAAGPGGESPAPWILPHVDVRSPNLAAIADAIQRRKRIRFRYRATGAAEAAERSVEPHSLRFRSAWYVHGHDTGRAEPRSFKLDRIEGAVKVAAGKQPDFEPPPAAPVEWPSETGEADLEARVAVDAGIAWWAERRPGVRTIGTRDDGRVELAVAVPDEDRFARWAIGFGDAAEVLGPPPLREEVVRRLRRAAEGGSG